MTCRGRRRIGKSTLIAEFASRTAKNFISIVGIGSTGRETPNGSYAEALRDLQFAGFVAENSGLSPLTGKPIKQPRYRVRDNYARFYLKTIEPRSTAIKSGLFSFSSLEQLNGWDSILGLQFQNMILAVCRTGLFHR